MPRLFIVVLCMFVAAGAFAAATKDIHKTLPLAADGSVSVDTHNGSVVVTAWNQPSVDVSAHVEADDDSDLRATNVNISGGGSSVSIVSDYPEQHFYVGIYHTPVISYTIRVPATARVRVSEHNARTVVTGMRGDVVIRSHNGPVRLRDLAGAADVETHNGSVDVEFATFTKASRFTTHNGDVEVALPAASRFTLDADTHRGHAVSSDFPLTVTSSRQAMHATVNGGGPALRFDAHNGSLKLRRR